jgi:peptidoglycan/LPS O-acetylase OafA/YrhL
MTNGVVALQLEDAPAEVHARSQTASHTAALDGVRGIAVFLVFLFHLGSILRSQSFLSAALSVGWLGVDLFFVLSGFLITRILIATREDRQYYYRFYMRRGLRIWPLYFAFVLVMYFGLHMIAHVGAVQRFAAGSAHLNGNLPMLSLPLICYLLFIQNLIGFSDLLGMTWSLCIEEHFYLIWPFLVRKFSLTAVKRTLWTAFALSPLLRIAYYFYAQSRHINFTAFYATIYHSTPFHLDSIIAGSLLGIYWVEHEGHERLRSIFRLVAIVGLVFSSLCLIFEHKGFVCCLTYAAASILFAGCVGLVLFGWNRRLLVNPQLRYLGKISFGFYLIHPVVINLLQSHPLLHRIFPFHRVFLMEISGAVLATILSLSLAAASYAWFERPILGLKSRLAP